MAAGPSLGAGAFGEGGRTDARWAGVLERLCCVVSLAVLVGLVGRSVARLEGARGRHGWSVQRPAGRGRLIFWRTVLADGRACSLAGGIVIRRAGEESAGRRGI